VCLSGLVWALSDRRPEQKPSTLPFVLCVWLGTKCVWL
jgi:hypothetical protein